MTTDNHVRVCSLKVPKGFYVCAFFLVLIVRCSCPVPSFLTIFSLTAINTLSGHGSVEASMCYSYIVEGARVVIFRVSGIFFRVVSGSYRNRVVLG